MPSDVSEEISESTKITREQKLSPMGTQAIQGSLAEQQVIESSEFAVDTHKIPKEDVQRHLGRNSLWTTDKGQLIEPKGSKGRGVDYERLKNANIGGTFEAIDDFDAKTGTATSLKSLDLNAPTYKDNPSPSKSLINSYIDDLADFPGSASNQRGKRVEIMPEDIKNRNLSLAVPMGALTDDNCQILLECKKYAMTRNVNLLIDEVA